VSDVFAVSLKLTAIWPNITIVFACINEESLKLTLTIYINNNKFQNKTKRYFLDFSAVYKRLDNDAKSAGTQKGSNVYAALNAIQRFSIDEFRSLSNCDST